MSLVLAKLLALFMRNSKHFSKTFNFELLFLKNKMFLSVFFSLSQTVKLLNQNSPFSQSVMNNHSPFHNDFCIKILFHILMQQSTLKKFDFLNKKFLVKIIIINTFVFSFFIYARCRPTFLLKLKLIIL